MSGAVVSERYEMKLEQQVQKVIPVVYISDDDEDGQDKENISSGGCDDEDTHMIEAASSAEMKQSHTQQEGPKKEIKVETGFTANVGVGENSTDSLTMREKIWDIFSRHTNWRNGTSTVTNVKQESTVNEADASSKMSLLEREKEYTLRLKNRTTAFATGGTRSLALSET